MTVDVSVVIPVCDGAATLGVCLDAVIQQRLPSERYEVIVVDDGSTDASPAIAAGRPGVRLVQQHHHGAGAARNAGVNHASGTWIAFTDADAIPTRGWLDSLLAAVDESVSSDPPLGAAGQTVGHASTTAPARFCDLIGSLDAARHLAHPVYPFPPMLNVLYRREAFTRAGGFDDRYTSFEGCDLHTRLLREDGGRFVYAPRAVVLHRHRETWRRYWRQQRSYGRGYAQFFLHHRVPWSVGRELKAWFEVARVGLAAAWSPRGDDGLVRRGTAVKQLAQRIGFAGTYWRSSERERWSDASGG